MYDPKLLQGFAIRFAAIFALLALPWPGFRNAFCVCFQTESRLLLRLAMPSKLTIVEKNVDPVHPSIDTKIIIPDRKEIQPDGMVPVKIIVLDSRSLGWMPNAMMIALLGATPAIWSHSRKALLMSILSVNAFVAATILVSVYHGIFKSSSPAGWPYFSYAYQLLVTNLWLSFLFPTLIWFACLVLALPGGCLSRFGNIENKKRQSALSSGERT